MTYGPAPAPLKAGETYASLVVGAVNDVRTRGVDALLSPLASSAHHMVESALDELITDPNSRQVIEQAVAPALQLVESLARDFVSGSGAGGELSKEVLALLEGAVGGAVASNIAAAIPAVGSLVNWFSSYFDMKAKQAEIDREKHAAACAAAFIPITGSWPGNETRPADVFYSTSAHDFTSAGATLWSVLGFKKATFAEACKQASEDARPTWPPCHYAHKDHLGFTYAERVTLRSVHRAMTALAGRFDTDGGASLWPCFIDTFARRARKGSISINYVQGVRAAVDDCWQLDTRPTSTIFALIDGWLKTLDYNAARSIPLLDTATIRTIVTAAIAHKQGRPLTRVSLETSLVHALHRTATSRDAGAVAALQHWDLGDPWPL